MSVNQKCICFLYSTHCQVLLIKFSKSHLRPFTSIIPITPRFNLLLSLTWINSNGGLPCTVFFFNLFSTLKPAWSFQNASCFCPVWYPSMALRIKCKTFNMSYKDLYRLDLQPLLTHTHTHPRHLLCIPGIMVFQSLIHHAPSHQKDFYTCCSFWMEGLIWVQLSLPQRSHS